MGRGTVAVRVTVTVIVAVQSRVKVRVAVRVRVRVRVRGDYFRVRVRVRVRVPIKHAEVGRMSHITLAWHWTITLKHLPGSRRWLFFLDISKLDRLSNPHLN